MIMMMTMPDLSTVKYLMVSNSNSNSNSNISKTYGK